MRFLLAVQAKVERIRTKSGFVCLRGLEIKGKNRWNAIYTRMKNEWISVLSRGDATN